MKRIILTFCVVAMTFIGFQASAQESEKTEKTRPSREELTQKQAEYIAKSLELDSEKSAKFIATFCECQKEIMASVPRMCKDRKGAETDEEAAAMAQQRFERGRKIIDIREKYYNEYSKFLTPLQIEKVYKLEQKTVKKMRKHQKSNKKDAKHMKQQKCEKHKHSRR